MMSHEVCVNGVATHTFLIRILNIFLTKMNAKIFVIYNVGLKSNVFLCLIIVEFVDIHIINFYEIIYGIFRSFFLKKDRKYSLLILMQKKKN